jgi:VanZ family protein
MCSFTLDNRFAMDAQLSDPDSKTRFENSALQRVAPIVAWVVLAFLIYATVSPLASRPDFLASTTNQHLLAYAALTVLFCQAYPQRVGLLFLLVIAGILLLETAQVFLPDRHARIRDIIEKITGAIGGICIAKVWLYARVWTRRAR